MSNKHRHGAPEAPKASSAPVKPTIVENAAAPSSAPDATLGSISELVRNERDVIRECPACRALNGEPPCSVECYVAAGYLAENYEKHFGARSARATGVALQGVTLPADGLERTVHLDPTRRKPLPEGAVVVEALVGVVVRVQHRNPGERFWLLKSRPDDDANPLSEYADEFVARGEVEIL